MLVSILHRMCGVALATAGTAMFVWWLLALAVGAESYAVFHAWVVQATAGGAQSVTNIVARIVAIGLSWAFFQHLANGVRHLFMDIGANFELRRNKQSSVATIVFALAATVVMWGYIFMGKA